MKTTEQVKKVLNAFTIAIQEVAWNSTLVINRKL